MGGGRGLAHMVLEGQEVSGPIDNDTGYVGVHKKMTGNAPVMSQESTR